MSAVAAAVLTGLAVGVWPSGRDMVRRRLAALDAHDRRQVASIGIAATIAAMSASVRHGATVVEAFEEQAGRRFATARVTAPRATEALLRRTTPDETEFVDRIARRLQAACALGDELGGGTARCLDAVGAAWRRERLVEDRRRVAVAGPRSSARLMTGLPVATLLLGETMGARPLRWLLGSTPGMVALAAGIGCYACGVLWMRRLLATLHGTGDAR
ncbi:Flp pilus assembly protein [Bifidobacterium sp. DSM 109958]|uniref:Flp pilus assembly protein n=1 Tax=Bifidobacterium moraviense TaxID=2675323 RepID=A0A7Y0F2B8_9BIFI|nr:pilus assembly protein [Bifidobacterium sp. DSM 109958]NMN00574.1 Flp pilus assembly protein [Bifidobacterium sp. DSM 109958]